MICSLIIHYRYNETNLYFSAHKVKGTEGGKSGKKEKQKDEPSPVNTLIK